MSIKNESLQCKKKSTRLALEVEQKISNSIDRIRSAFSKREIDNIAWETGFTKRVSSKVLGRDFLVTLLISSLDAAHSSLEKISSILNKVNRDVRITAQSIMERINRPEAADFCLRAQEMILNRRLSIVMETIPPALLSYFNEVFLHDSTVLELNENLQDSFKGSGGRSSKSSAKIDVIYELLKKRYVKFTLTDQKKTDSSLASEVDEFLTESSLVIRDLGYLRIDSLRNITQNAGYYLSRLKANFSVFIGPCRISLPSVDLP